MREKTKRQPDKVSILIADDDTVFREFMVDALSCDEYEITEFDPCADETNKLHEKFDVAILDIMMKQTSGFDVQNIVLQNSPNVQVIMITGFPDMEKHNRAMESGVFMFLTKPVRAEQLFYAIKGAVQVNRLRHDALKYRVADESQCPGLIGKSDHIIEIKRKIFEYAPMDTPVLICGESGTGKEVVAKCVHLASSRAEKPLIAVNCAGLSPNLIESELFGHVQGAFTGASKTRHGFFAAADGGTLFLDEIGEMPLHVQSKLLRILDSGEYYRVGDTKKHFVDVRIISATNRDLDQMVREGTFRKDLLYRLQGVWFELQPLRNRREDIKYLTRYFTRDKDYVFSNGAIKLLLENSWPGNVRELAMFVTGFSAASCGEVITESAVREKLSLRAPGAAVSDVNEQCDVVKFQEYRKMCERSYFEDLIKKAEGNISKAAQMSGIDRKNLREKLKLFELY